MNEQEENKVIESWNDKNIIKLRDYKVPTPVEEINEEKLRSEIEPWLTALFQSEHLSLLTGAGISSAIHYMAKNTSGAGMEGMTITEFKEQIEKKAKETAEKTGRGTPNIEDEIRIINDISLLLFLISWNGEIVYVTH